MTDGIRKEKLLKKKDIILIIVLLVISIGGIFIYQMIGKQSLGSNAEVVVQIHGEEYGRYSLNKDQEIEIKATHGTSILKIEDGKAKMLSAGCPDQVCVKHSAIYTNYDDIVCIPNEIIVKIENGQESELDSIVQ